MKKNIILLFSFFSFYFGYSQNENSRPFSISAGISPNYYFNNIETFREYVKPINYGFHTRILWNSIHRISLGLDISPQKMYHVTDFSKDENAYINLWAIPIHFFISMKISKKLYGYCGFGPSFLQNNASNSNTNIQSNSLSISDMQIGLGYKIFQLKKFDFSIESKYFISTKNEDMNISFPIMISYKL